MNATAALTATAEILTTADAATHCLCGCGQSVAKWYKSGHDAAHVSILVGMLENSVADGASDIAAVAESMLSDLPSTPLRMKFVRAAVRAVDFDAPQVERQVAFTHEVKVGRWTYPARTFHGGAVERNTKRDGSGEWVAFSYNK